jgi:L-threonylcarbamoyladenylate synthase
MVDYQNDIVKCLEVLKRGGLILYPTDTVWGIGCDASNEKAVKRIYEVKKRKSKKAMIVLVAEERDILKYVAQPDMRILEFLQQTTKPTTVVYKGVVGLAENLANKDGTIAIRICKDEFCRHLIKQFRKPVVSTSANISTYPTPLNFNQVPDEIKNAVDYIVKYRQEDLDLASASSVIKWNKDGSLKVIRE